jgi:hypothetical protein
MTCVNTDIIHELVNAATTFRFFLQNSCVLVLQFVRVVGTLVANARSYATA